MKLVSQAGWPDACQQACIAMLADLPIEDVIAVVGDQRLGTSERRSAWLRFNIAIPDEGFLIQPYGSGSLARLMKEFPRLWCGVMDARNSMFSHCVVIDNGNLYDPHYGLNPQWPWSHYVMQVQPILGCPALPLKEQQ